MRISWFRSSKIPYDLFDHQRTSHEAEQARKMERIYFKGQERIWDGKQILKDLIQQYGGVNLSSEKTAALHQVFGMILWGELAAWKVSAALADRLVPFEAKLAATAQAHDEARHFYVMHDYLALTGYRTAPLPHPIQATLESVLNTENLAKKLIGMQLMIEPIALTVFQTVREAKVEPILSALLPYYERDEARHVALGINYLPELLRGMSHTAGLKIIAWQLRMFDYEVRGMHALESGFRTLGVDPKMVLRLGMAKQLIAFRALAKELGEHMKWIDPVKRLFDFRIEATYPSDNSQGWRKWMTAAKQAWVGVREAETSLLPEV